MKTSLTALLNLIYRFYPRGVRDIPRMHVPPGEPIYVDTAEHCRLIERAARGRREHQTWDQMLDRLRVQFDTQNESLHLLSGQVDPAYSGRVWLSENASINFHVSLLGPYYGIQLPGVRNEELVAREIAREIETSYPDFQTVPAEIGDEIVPDVYAGPPFGEATIYICLFSELWTRVYRDVDANG
jgi:hypothetical protein